MAGKKKMDSSGAWGWGSQTGNFSSHFKGRVPSRRKHTTRAFLQCSYPECNYGNNRLIWGKGTQVVVTPNITNPDPAIYQLKSPITNTSLCLFTDFDKENATANPIAIFHTPTTVLDMRSTDSKSNAALALVNNSQIHCAETFQGSFYSSSDLSCDASLVEKSFEADWNLNLQNLSVIGLRILFLKVAGFNLLMTLRLWSS